MTTPPAPPEEPAEDPEVMAARLIADPDLPWIGEPTDDDPTPDEARLSAEPETAEVEA